MNKKYFAYGSCVNIGELRKSLEYDEHMEDPHICGVGILDGHRLAFTRMSTNWQGGVLDIVESPTDYVLGLVYEMAEEDISKLDNREGAPRCYRRVENLKIALGHEEVAVFSYTVVNKELGEIEPSAAYFDKVYEGMRHRFPAEYVNKYLIRHCNKRFGRRHREVREDSLYHYNEGQSSEFMERNPEFYQLMKEISLFLGNGNDRVETIKPTPEMFRILVKCVGIAARDRLDYGHLIPRGLYNRLAGEFQRISGVNVQRLADT